ncbi:hypothetical protein [Escherichia coli]|uniref:hypothetical protein n=1 Tax=Escherichia coli TaxID=562 RepID=UPI003D9C9B49
MAGSWKPGSVFALKGGFEELDYGHDFYAPQSMLAEDGRRIIMAWMNMWDSPVPPAVKPWQGAGSLVLSLR